MVDVDLRVLSHLKEEQAWAADKRFWVICYVLVLRS